jgi:hypothetical protein
VGRIWNGPGVAGEPLKLHKLVWAFEAEVLWQVVVRGGPYSGFGVDSF